MRYKHKRRSIHKKSWKRRLRKTGPFAGPHPQECGSLTGDTLRNMLLSLTTAAQFQTALDSENERSSPRVKTLQFIMGRLGKAVKTEFLADHIDVLGEDATLEGAVAHLETLNESFMVDALGAATDELPEGQPSQEIMQAMRDRWEVLLESEHNEAVAKARGEDISDSLIEVALAVDLVADDAGNTTNLLAAIQDIDSVEAAAMRLDIQEDIAGFLMALMPYREAQEERAAEEAKAAEEAAKTDDPAESKTPDEANEEPSTSDDEAGSANDTSEEEDKASEETSPAADEGTGEDSEDSDKEDN